MTFYFCLICLFIRHQRQTSTLILIIWFQYSSASTDIYWLITKIDKEFHVLSNFNLLDNAIPKTNDAELRRNVCSEIWRISYNIQSWSERESGHSTGGSILLDLCVRLIITEWGTRIVADLKKFFSWKIYPWSSSGWSEQWILHFFS